MPDTTEGTTPTGREKTEETPTPEKAAPERATEQAPEHPPETTDERAAEKTDDKPLPATAGTGSAPTDETTTSADSAEDSGETASAPPSQEASTAEATSPATEPERGEESEKEARQRAAAEAESAGDEAGETAPEPSGDETEDLRAEPQAGPETPPGGAPAASEGSSSEAQEEAAEPEMPTDPVSLELLEHLESGTPIQGKVFGWNQGGYHVLIKGLLAFCPRSEIDLGNPKGPKRYVEKTYPFRVIEHRAQGNRFIVSRARILEEERAKKQEAVKERLDEGAELEGRVTSLTGFGAFVDLGGGIEGMVHISELSHKSLDQPKEMLKKGQKVQVKVLKIERQGERISLSMKALEPNPWKHFAENHPRGSEFTGKITGTTDFGVFVELEPGMEGLVHVSALPPGTSLEDETLQEGREISGWVKDTEVKRRRVSLSLKPVPTSDPWKDVAEKYPEGDVVDGTVEEIAPFGVFINLEPGLTGLLPNSEMKLPRGTQPARVYPPGTEVKVQVGRLEPKRKRITLLPEGSKVEGSRTDFKEFKKKASSTGGMPTLAAAFEKLKKEEDS